MPCEHIDDLSDPRLDVFRDLRATNHPRWRDRFIAEGAKLVDRLLDSPFPVLSLVVGPRFREQYELRVAETTPIYVVSDQLASALVGFRFHRGVLACARRLPGPTLDVMLAGQARRKRMVVCPDVTDPENLGAILRNGAAFDVDGVLLGSPSADPWGRRVLRVSMGASFVLPISVGENLAGDLETLRRTYGVELWASVIDRDAQPLDSLPTDRDIAVLLGNEGRGLSADWVAQCDRRVTIPMRAGQDSLNVATSSGVFLYHLRRRPEELGPAGKSGDQD